MRRPLLVRGAAPSDRMSTTLTISAPSRLRVSRCNARGDAEHAERRRTASASDGVFNSVQQDQPCEHCYPCSILSARSLRTRERTPAHPGCTWVNHFAHRYNPLSLSARSLPMRAGTPAHPGCTWFNHSAHRYNPHLHQPADSESSPTYPSPQFPNGWYHGKSQVSCTDKDTLIASTLSSVILGFGNVSPLGYSTRWR